MNKRLARGITLALSPHGFAKIGDTWRRSNPIGFDVVHVHLAPYSTGVTAVVGEYYKALGNDTNPIVDKCHLRRRLVAAAGADGVDLLALEFDDSEAQVAQIVAVLLTDGLPWFDLVRTKAGALGENARDAEASSAALADALAYGSILLT